MPELPEVEVTRRAIQSVAQDRSIRRAVLRVPALRWPIAPDLPQVLAGRKVIKVARRGKYLLLHCAGEDGPGCLLIHLGMSGSLTVHPLQTAPRKHDHFDLEFEHLLLRLHDPRRFGALLWLGHVTDLSSHPLLAKLGVEPLDAGFDGEMLWRALRGRRVAIKQALLAGDVVVGVGNIYCSEALFRAGIHPAMPAGKLSRVRAQRLVSAIRATLTDAIAAGGSSLRDFVSGTQEMGYFQINALVYDRAGEPCRVCGTTIQRIVQGQRASYLCRNCQKR